MSNCSFFECGPVLRLSYRLLICVTDKHRSRFGYAIQLRKIPYLSQQISHIHYAAKDQSIKRGQFQVPPLCSMQKLWLLPTIICLSPTLNLFPLLTSTIHFFFLDCHTLSWHFWRFQVTTQPIHTRVPSPCSLCPWCDWSSYPPIPPHPCPALADGFYLNFI